MRPEFTNCEVYTFEDETQKKAMADAVAKVESEAGKEYDLLIGGEYLKGDGTFDTINPAVFRMPWSKTPHRRHRCGLCDGDGLGRLDRLGLAATLKTRKSPARRRGEFDYASASGYTEMLLCSKSILQTRRQGH